MTQIRKHLFKLLLSSLALLPLSWVQVLGSIFGRYAWLVQGRAAQVTQKNISLCYPHLSAEEQQAFAKRSLIETGKTLMEASKAWCAPLSTTLDYIKRVEERVDVEGMLAEGKGMITIVPHLGNWEILNLYAANRFQLNVLYQPPKQPELDQLIVQARARLGTKVYPTDRRGVAAMFQALQRGEVVGILPDQEPPPNASQFAPFLGVPAATMTLFSKLIQKTGAKVTCAFAKRLKTGEGFEVVFMPPDPLIYSKDLAISVAALNRSVEACIKEAPEQYQWEYKRFKSGPQGSTHYYRPGT